MKKKLIWILVSFCIFSFSACGSVKKQENDENKKNENNVVVVSNSTFAPLAKELVENYNVNSKYNINIEILERKELAKKIKDKDNYVSIGYSKLKIKDLQEEMIGIEGLAIIVNKNNKLDNITSEQMKNIYINKIKNFNELNNKSQQIKPIVYENKENVIQKAFEDNILNKPVKENIKGNIEYASDVEYVKKIIKDDENSIGYIPLMSVDDSVKMIKLNGVTLNVNSLKSDLYKASIPIYLQYHDMEQDMLNDFIRYVKSDNGKKVINKYCIESNS
ncbi:substrate-binding domain-containing protein [Haloimpatiens sp. FM7330]|uniref:substrate-binding domain-containing protein n=1 Tax=Haloimpatiens sp. FM7330 TaxID=3298610 RepID=UPI00362B0EB9